MYRSASCSSLPSRPGPQGEGAPRRLKPSDAAALMRLRHEAVRTCAVQLGTAPVLELQKNRGDYRRQLLAGLRPRAPVLMGLWREGELIGMAGVRLRRHRGRDCGFIFSVYVDPAFRGRGCARELLAACRCETLDRWGTPRCQLTVEVDNTPALALFQSSGFRILEHLPGAFRLEGVAHDVYLLESSG